MRRILGCAGTVVLVAGLTVLWLVHRSHVASKELGAPPDEIELAEEVPRPSSDGSTESFRVYRFRMHPPHWNAKHGWTAAVAGPYVPGSTEPTVPSLVFSTFTPYESLSAAEHVRRTLAETESATVRR